MDRRDFLKGSSFLAGGLPLVNIDTSDHIIPVREPLSVIERWSFNPFQDVEDIFCIDRFDIRQPGKSLEYATYNAPYQDGTPAPITCPMYDIVQSVDVDNKYIKQDRFDVLKQAHRILMNSMRKHVKDDCFHCLMMAAGESGVIYPQAKSSLQSKSSSVCNVADYIVCSPEAAEKGFWQKSKIIICDELGRDQEYQDWFEQYVVKTKMYSEIFIGIKKDKSNRIVSVPRQAPPIIAVDHVPRYEPSAKYNCINYYPKERALPPSLRKELENRTAWNALARFGCLVRGSGNAFIGYI